MKTIVEHVEPDLLNDTSDAPLLAALRAHPVVADAVIRRRRTPAGSVRTIAYVQPAARCDSEALMQHLRTLQPQLSRMPDHVVMVSSIPHSAHGCVDAEALDRLEVIDQGVAGEVEATLLQVVGAGADQLAVLVMEREFSREMLPISRLIPPKSHRPDHACTSEVSIDSRPALLQGPPLVLPPDTPMSLAGVLLRAADVCGDTPITHIAHDGSSRVQTHLQLLTDARRVLTGLRLLGLEPGRQVLLQLEQTQQFITGFWACILGGFVPVPLSIPQSYSTDNAIIQRAKNAFALLDAPPILTGDALVQTWNDLGRSLGMADLRVAGLGAMSESAPSESIHQSNLDDLALLLLTSGSTGAPKAVMHTHRTLISRCAAACEMEGHDRDSVSVNWMPLDHVGGIVMWHLRDVFAGASQVLVPTNWILENPLRWLDLLSDYRATSTWAPNFGYALINDRADEIARGRWNLSALRFALNGGEMIVAATARKFLRLLAPHGLPGDAMHPAWGMSETSSGVTCDFSFTLDSSSDEDASVCVGKAVRGFEARIVDEQDCVLRIGQVGRLQVRGASVTPGYFRNPHRNTETFTSDGWLKTGDLARIDDRGLSITGREKDEIIVNGVNIPAAEIEAAAESVAGVRASCTAACAFRRGDANTDGVALFFSCASGESGCDAGVVARRLREQLAESFGLVPDDLVPIDPEQIPRTSIGKIRRAELRERLEAGDFDQQRILFAPDPAESVPQWCYRPQWLRRESASCQSELIAGTRIALIVQDDSGVAELLHRSLSRGGWNVCAVHPPASRLAIHGALPDLVYYPLRGEAPESTIELLQLIQSLHHTDITSSRKLRLIVWAAGNAISPTAAAAAAALLRSAMREMPWLAASVVEILDSTDWGAAAELLCRESAESAAADIRVRYLDVERLVLRLIPVALAHRDRPSVLQEAGRYIITGGLGGIGVELARHLLTVWHAKLLIVGRRQADASSCLAMLRSLGDVRYAAAPVEDLQKLRTVVEAAEREWGANVNGAFHLAGEFHEQPIDTETPHGLHRSMSPKLEGARSLRAILSERPGRTLLVAFGSANGYFGGAGAGAYAVANAAMTGLLTCDARGRVETRCLEWSMWDGIGMSRGYADHRATVAAGFDLINVRQGIASLEAALRLDDQQLIIGINCRAPAMRPYVQTPPLNLQKLAICHNSGVHINPAAALRELHDPFGAAIDVAVHEMDLSKFRVRGSIDRDSLRRRLCDRDELADAEPRTDVERLVAAAFAEVLGMLRVGRDEHFLEIGGNSLAATQVISRLRPRFGTAISVRDLFEHPTIAGLAESLEHRSDTNEPSRQETLGSAPATVNEAEIDVNGLSDEQVTAMLDLLMAGREESR